MTKQRIRFVINPISGTGRVIKWSALIQQYLDSKQFDYEIKYTSAQGDATTLAIEAANQNIDIVCAVGGDGTINEVAQGLVNTTTSLAILPRGSGNGLARHFTIPTKPTQAILQLNQGKVHHMDAGLINDKLFLCVAGIGFDATVAHAFDAFGKRGLLSYAWLSLKAFLSYKPYTYNIRMDQQSIRTKAFLLTFANASQFGNNAYIAPEAHTNDGLLNLTVIKPFPLWATLGLLIKTFNKKLHLSKYCESYTFNTLTLQSDNPQTHIDGEPLLQTEELQVQVQPNCLKIFY
ncbi:diacylglycerol kinase family lipid kinase [Reichenbachiella carrageenanivorans]|uniref:Diacylglycerol kinase family lipid kinase n=1 Tax=Reichenbachiella carrageenanivorans TaxID=2979869 RepID=A0ABY6D3F6_9BACT|nr:diacylglycerol kinase family protein [Reichenbachiella carrageenanivorans]UXX79638.1 diacylglycerol kinase family lipid kinase [Reichenbachiella carrageenanivorans]